MGNFRVGAQNAQTYLAQVAAATATGKLPIFTAPCKCRVLSVSITPHAATTGDNTNTKNLNLVNTGAVDGSGTTEVGNLDLVTGVDLALDVRKAIPLNATYLNGADLVENAVLAMEFEKVGTGVVVGPLNVNVEWIPV